MKIVLTVHQFLPDFSAGTEVLAYSTAKELIKRGHEVLVWTGYPTEGDCAVDSYVYDGIPVKRYSFNPAIAGRSADRVRLDYKNEQFEVYFDEFIEDYRPDLLHFFHLGRLSATAVEVGKRHGIPMVFTPTDFWAICITSQLRLPDNSLCPGPDKCSANCIRHLVKISQQGLVGKAFELMPDWMLKGLSSMAAQKWWPEQKYSPMVVSLGKRLDYLKGIINSINKVLIPTRIMHDVLIKYGLEPERAIMQPYGIRIEAKEVLPVKKLGSCLRLGFIGTLSEHKGAHVLIKAVKLLSPDIPVKLKIYGSESDFPEYAAYLKELAGIDPRIAFCGTFPNSEINSVFSELDALVVPSIWYENTPLVVLTAQLNKVPVIASDVGGISEVIIQNFNGLLFEKGNHEALAAEISRLVRDSKLLSMLSENAAKPKSIGTYTDELEKIYKSIL